MLFHSSIRKELARSFGATLVVLVTVVMTMTLIRTVGEASRGSFNPTDVLMIMGYTVLSDLPTILTLSLFISVVSVLTRMYKDSEMVIWFGSGRGLLSLVAPLFRFAWPILVGIFVLAFLIIPWSFSRIEDMRDRYEKRGDLARVEPGQFQESANGDRVFFIEKDASGQPVGHNVFIATSDFGKETITSARRGEVKVIGSDRYLVLENGQRLERSLDKDDVSVAVFGKYGAKVGVNDASARSYAPAASIASLDLLRDPKPLYLGELFWRLGLGLAAINFIVIGLAAAGMNPRVGRVANLGFAFMAFVVYFNMLVLGKSWISNGQIHFAALVALVHGLALALGCGWLLKRHSNWSVQRLFKPRASAQSPANPPQP